MIYIWYHIRYHEMACTWYYIRYHEMVPVTLQYIPTIYEGYFGYCRYIPRIYGNAYTVTWLVPKFRRFHLSEICGGYRTSGHKTDIVNHIPDIILDSLITYLVYSFVQEYTKYITVLWQNIYKNMYVYVWYIQNYSSLSSYRRLATDGAKKRYQVCYTKPAFLHLTTIFVLSFAISTYCCPQQECITSRLFCLCGTSWFSYPLMFCVEQKWSAASRH